MKEWLEDGDKKGWFRRYYEYFGVCLNPEKDKTDKQTIAAAILLLGDLLMRHFIFGLPLEEAQEDSTRFAARVSPLLKSKRDVDLTARAYDFIVGFVVQNRLNFELPNKYDRRDGDERYASVGVANCMGRIEEDEGVAYIVANALACQLRDTNYPLGKVTKELAERGLLIPGKGGKTSCIRRINKTNTRCYAIKLPPDP